MKQSLFKYVSIQLFTGWIILFALTPLCLMLALSFFSSSETVLYKLPLTLEHFKLIFSSQFYRIVARSFLIALLSAFVCFVIAYPFSYLLAQTKKKNLLLMLVLIPFWTSSLIRTYALIGLLKTRGLLNNLLLKLHIISAPLDMLYNQMAVIIGLCYNLLPFMILPLYNTFDKFDRTLISAGQDLNASHFYIFRKIIWPISLPGVKNSFIMVFFPAMTLFYIPNILGGAKSLLLGNLIENQFLLLNDWPGGAATSLILSLTMLVMVYLLKRKEDATS